MTTIYKKQCSDFRDSMLNSADSFYNHQIDVLNSLIQEANDKGLNPSNMVIEGGIANVDYNKLLNNTVKAKDEAYLIADTKASECDSNAVPDWLEDAQKTTDISMALILLPYIVLTKNYAAAKIDIGEIYKGNTFGGDSAFIPKARDDVLNALGIVGETAKLLRDPVNTVKDIVSDAAKVIDDIIPDITFPDIKIELPEIRIDLPKLPKIF